METDEVEHLYNLFKVKLRRFKMFWISYIKFEVEKRGKAFDAVFFKVLEYLRVKVFEGKEDLAESLQNERDMLKSQMGAETGETRSLSGHYVGVNSHTSMGCKGPVHTEESFTEKDLDDASVSTVEILSSNIFIDQVCSGTTENVSNACSSAHKNTSRPGLLKTQGTSDVTMEVDCTAPESLGGFVHEDCVLSKPPAHCKGTSHLSNSTRPTRTAYIGASSTGVSGCSLVARSDSGVESQQTKDLQKMADARESGAVKQSSVAGRLKAKEPAFELELSGPQNFQKLRFSPKKRTPYGPQSPKKAVKHKENVSGRRFVDITSRDEIDCAFTCDLFDKTINFNQRHSTTTFKDKEFICINRIGKGGYSNVYSVFHGGELYALKQIRAEDQESLNICLDEIGLLRKLSNCEFVIRMIDYEIKGEIVNILLEYGETDLQKLIQSGPMNTFYIKYIWESILSILVFIHANRIVHRDIKPANFVLVKGKVRIIDFGISKSIRGDTTSILNFEKAGTLNYISPEQCSGGKVSRSSDVWAAGCILYHMVYRKNIHSSKNVMDVLRKMADEAEIEYGEADVHAVESMKACLVYDPKKRARPEELLRFQFLKKT